MFSTGHEILDALKVGCIAGSDILRAEQAENEAILRSKQTKATRVTAKAAGVIFIPANGEDVGVRLRRSPVTQPSTEPHP